MARWKKGVSANPGGLRGLGKRKMTAAVKEALEGKGKHTFADLAEMLINHAMQTEDRSVSLKAIKEIKEWIDGRTPVQKETDGEDIANQQGRVFFLGINAQPRLVEANGHAPIELQAVEDNDQQNGNAS